MRALRRTAVLAASIAAVAAAAVPATAGAFVTATGTSHGVVNNGRLTMVVDCEAAGVGAYASIAITACYVTNGVSAPLRALPGNASATAATGTGSLMPYSLCVRAIGTDINSRTDDTGLRCQNDLLGASQGVVLATSAA